MKVCSLDSIPATVQQQILLRPSQLQQLSLFYNRSYPSPAALLAYGPEDTCKCETIQLALSKQSIDHVLIDCRECLSQRHLLTKIFARCVKLLEKEDDLDRYDRLDNINALASNLRKTLENRREKLVILVANADQQRGATATLFPALARLGDLISCLSIIFTTTTRPRPILLRKTGVPHVHFPPYNRTEAVQIIFRDPPLLLPRHLPEYVKDVSEEKTKILFGQFAATVYDTLIAPTTTSISKYRQTCIKLWPRFIWPVISAEPMPGTRANTDWDFARLISRNRNLFQAEGEEALQDRLTSTSSQPRTFEELIANKSKQDEQTSNTNETALSLNPATTFKPLQPNEQSETPLPQQRPLLKYLPTLILLSAYLASHTPAKHDIVLFSRLSTSSTTSRRKRKYLARSRAGGISRSPKKASKTNNTNQDDDNDPNDNDNDGTYDDNEPTTPSKKKLSAKELGANGTTTPKKERADRSMRAIFEKTSNVARPFILERLIAILRAIHPDGVGSTTATGRSGGVNGVGGGNIGKGIADKVYKELSELERLRLVVRVDPDGKLGSDEALLEERWKCIVGREWVVQAGRYWGVGLEGWEFE